MKKIILVLSLVFAIQSTFAQEKEQKTPEQRAEQATNHLAKEITLTQIQRDKIYAINLQAVNKKLEIRKQSSLTDEVKKEQLKQANLNRKKAIQAELTAEQIQQIKAKKKAKKEKIVEEDDL